MPVFSEACMCLRWPGRTVAGQKQVSKDDCVCFFLVIHTWALA